MSRHFGLQTLYKSSNVKMHPGKRSQLRTKERHGVVYCNCKIHENHGLKPIEVWHG